ncbi:hypothetical protein TCAL_15419 [Tigriopus californicus]|uniref:Uncharacterized protein n=1 Tax=Tigriopus californicus TaxID=6832 RepID=A0A553PRF5_TIGCA|nr:hypothetical protein TCAL_15419 [Tigriopus californicus]
MSRTIATLDSSAALSGHGGGYAYVSKDTECCPPVIDPLTLLTVLGAIAAVTVGLRQVAIDNIPGRRKRSTDMLTSILNSIRVYTAANIARSGHGGGGGGGGHGGGYAYVSKDQECCPPVIDPLTLLTVLGAIAAVTVGLRQVVIDSIPGRRKRSAEMLFSILDSLRVEVAERLSPLERTKRADAHHHGYPEYCPEGIPVEQALFAILATFAAAFGFLYTAVTMRQGRRRKRGAALGVSSEAVDWTVWSSDLVSAIVNMGAFQQALLPRQPVNSQALSRQVRASDLSGALSGHGYAEYCPEGIPVEQALFAILAAFAAAFGFLFRAVTLATARRKRRSLAGQPQLSWTEELELQAHDLVWWGR